MIVSEEKFKTDIKARTLEIFEYYKKYTKEKCKNEKIDRVSFNFELNETDNAKVKNEINGKAWSEGSVLNISINVGVINYLVRYYNKFFGPIEEDLREKGIIDKDTYIMETKLNHSLIPKFINVEVINLMIIFSYRFIILHELGHLIDGHIDYLKKLKNNKDFRLKMFTKIKSEENIALIERTLEDDADAFAATQSVIYMYEVICNPKLLLQDLYDEQYDIAFWFGFSIATLFLMFMDQKLNLDLDKKMSHLPPDVRLINIYSVFNKTIENYRIDQEILSKITIGMKFAEEWFNEINISTYDFIESVNNKSGLNEYIKEIRDCWRNKIYSELKPFAYVDLFEDIN